MIFKAMPNHIPRGAIHFALKTLARMSRVKTALSASVYELTELLVEDIGRYSGLVEKNYWPDSRLTVWREPSFWQSRLRMKTSDKLLGVWSRVEHKIVGLAIVKSLGGTLSLLDVLPPALSLQREFWRTLIRFAVRGGASSLRARLYVNNSVQAAVARQLYLTMGCSSVSTNVIFSVLVLDSKSVFAYDPHAWAGTEMLRTGF